jgi:hypothetical protein
VVYDYRPSFTTPTGSIAIDKSNLAGYARINFLAKDIQDGQETFFFAIRSVSVTARGGFDGSITRGEESGPTQGIATLTINVGPAKLVPASLYPEVPTFDGLSAP